MSDAGERRWGDKQGVSGSGLERGEGRAGDSLLFRALHAGLGRVGSL